MFDDTRRFYGLQFHPEVSHTKKGNEILERFILHICGCKPSWTTQNIIQDAIENIRQSVGHEHVILGLSGGVDSSVVAVLLQRAIGTQLTAVFVDTGLLRLNESQEVQTLFQKHFGIDLVVIDAKEKYLTALKNITDPEDKRKIIGKLFI
jgi:GMP synthase (glutamine-hydrolysing)